MADNDAVNPHNPDRRLIEDWLPIAELSEESRRERRSMTALPATYYLHVWFARRPLVANVNVDFANGSKNNSAAWTPPKSSN